MKKYVNLFVFVFMIGACLSQGRAQTKSAVSYKNPVVDIAMPDPTVIKAADGYFYVYATESTRNVPIMSRKRDSSSISVSLGLSTPKNPLI